MGALRMLLSLVGRLFQRRPAVPVAAAQPVRRINDGLYIAFGFLVAGIVLGFLHSGAWVFGGIAGALAVVAGTGVEVVQPDRAGHMQFGRYIGSVDRGWQFPIWGFSDCFHIPGKDIKVDLPKESLYTGEETDLGGGILVIVRLGETDDDLKKAALRLTRDFEETMGLFKKMAAAELRTVVGKRSFKALNKIQEKLEEEARTLLKNDFAEYGFKVVGVKIYDFTETTKSEAARIRSHGLARAEVRIKEAEAFKDNYPLAIATVGTVLADALAGGGPSGKGKKKPQGKQEDGGDEAEDKTDQNPVSAVVQGVADAARGLVGGRRRRS